MTMYKDFYYIVDSPLTVWVRIGDSDSNTQIHNSMALNPIYVQADLRSGDIIREPWSFDRDGDVELYLHGGGEVWATAIMKPYAQSVLIRKHKGPLAVPPALVGAQLRAIDRASLSDQTFVGLRPNRELLCRLTMAQVTPADPESAGINCAQTLRHPEQALSILAGTKLLERVRGPVERLAAEAAAAAPVAASATARARKRATP